MESGYEIEIEISNKSNFFLDYRIPREELDELRHLDSSVSRHIVVHYKGLHYTMDAFDSKNQILSPLAFYSQFEWMLKDAEIVLSKGIILERIKSECMAKRRLILKYTCYRRNK